MAGFYSDAVKSIIKEWKDDANVKGTILFRLHSVAENNKMKLVICTNRPGPMIGYKGELVAKYNQKLNNAFITKKDIEIEFIETDGLI